MERFIFISQSFHHFNCSFFRRFGNDNRLKPSFERRVFFNIFSVFGKSCCTDQLKVSARHSRFYKVCDIARTLTSASACTDYSMYFINKHYYFSLAVSDVFDEVFHAFFKFSPVGSTRQNSHKVKLENSFFKKRFRNLFCSNFFSKTFNNCGFTDACLADQSRIIFSSPRKNMNHPFNFNRPLDNRVQQALPCLLGQIYRILLH